MKMEHFSWLRAAADWGLFDQQTIVGSGSHSPTSLQQIPPQMIAPVVIAVFRTLCFVDCRKQYCPHRDSGYCAHIANFNLLPNFWGKTVSSNDQEFSFCHCIVALCGLWVVFGGEQKQWIEEKSFNEMWNKRCNYHQHLSTPLRAADQLTAHLRWSMKLSQVFYCFALSSSFSNQLLLYPPSDIKVS